MDLQQRKLTKSEWDSIEKPIPPGEIEVLNLITQGYADVNIRYNKNNTLLSFLKIETSDALEDYLFQKYFLATVTQLTKKYDVPELHAYKPSTKSKNTLKKV